MSASATDTPTRVSGAALAAGAALRGGPRRYPKDSTSATHDARSKPGRTRRSQRPSAGFTSIESAAPFASWRLKSSSWSHTHAAHWMPCTSTLTRVGPPADATAAAMGSTHLRSRDGEGSVGGEAAVWRRV
ncbi:MAG: hypothetical protein R3A52_01000 [Polyangiales bacterium]